jgi:hypothetical protein
MQVIKSINFDSTLLSKMEAVEDYCKQNKISFSSFAVDALMEKLQKNAEALPNPIGLPQTAKSTFLQQDNIYILNNQQTPLDVLLQVNEKKAREELKGNLNEDVNYKVKRICNTLHNIADTNLAKIKGTFVMKHVTVPITRP